MGVAVPEEYRGDMALAGEWQTLSETKIDPEGLEGAAKSIGVRKRKHEGEEEEEEEHAPEPLMSKGWGSRMKTYPGAQADDEDLDALLESTKDLKKTKTATPTTMKEEPQERNQESASVVKTEDEAPDSKTVETNEPPEVKTEDPGSVPAPTVDEKPPAEEAAGPVFKKRKPKVMRK
jgi:hypothetical protein